MRTFFAVVFDDVVQNTTPVYTEPIHNALLGSATRMSFQVISNVFTGGPTLTVAVEHSPDGRNWSQRLTSSPEIDRVSLSWTDTNNHVAAYDTSSLVGCNIRFRIELGGSATVRVKITACGRSRTPRDRTARQVEEVDAELAWILDGGDDALFDADIKYNLTRLEEAFPCDNALVARVRTELRRQAKVARMASANSVLARASAPADSQCDCKTSSPAGSDIDE